MYLPQSKRLLDQVREVLCYKHYSLKTEQAYLYWIRFNVRWHGRNGQMQHPRDMGGAGFSWIQSKKTSLSRSVVCWMAATTCGMDSATSASCRMTNSAVNINCCTRSRGSAT